jgi:hypothetical protein
MSVGSTYRGYLAFKGSKCGALTLPPQSGENGPSENTGQQKFASHRHSSEEETRGEIRVLQRGSLMMNYNDPVPAIWLCLVWYLLIFVGCRFALHDRLERVR